MGKKYFIQIVGIILILMHLLSITDSHACIKSKISSLAAQKDSLYVQWLGLYTEFGQHVVSYPINEIMIGQCKALIFSYEHSLELYERLGMEDSKIAKWLRNQLKIQREFLKTLQEYEEYLE